jgi:hypothetical protein
MQTIPSTSPTGRKFHRRKTTLGSTKLKKVRNFQQKDNRQVEKEETQTVDCKMKRNNRLWRLKNRGWKIYNRR